MHTKTLNYINLSLRCVKINNHVIIMTLDGIFHSKNNKKKHSYNQIIIMERQ